MQASDLLHPDKEVNLDPTDKAINYIKECSPYSSCGVLKNFWKRRSAKICNMIRFQQGQFGDVFFAADRMWLQGGHHRCLRSELTWSPSRRLQSLRWRPDMSGDVLCGHPPSRKQSERPRFYSRTWGRIPSCNWVKPGRNGIYHDLDARSLQGFVVSFGNLLRLVLRVFGREGTQLSSGYFSSRSDPTEIFKCMSPIQCPGNNLLKHWEGKLSRPWQ